jgi:hypothetical protein
LYDISRQEIYVGNFIDAKIKLHDVVLFFDKNFNLRETGKDYPLIFFYSVITLIDLNTKLGKQSENVVLYEKAYKKMKLNTSYEEYRAYFISCEGSDAFYNKITLCQSQN